MEQQLGPFNVYNIYDNCADHGGQLTALTTEVNTGADPVSIHRQTKGVGAAVVEANTSNESSPSPSRTPSQSRRAGGDTDDVDDADDAARGSGSGIVRTGLGTGLLPPLQPQGGQAYPCGMMAATEYWMNLPQVKCKMRGGG
jgi:hypothetical protein